MTNFRISEVYANRYLKSDDVGDSDLVLTIAQADLEPVGDHHEEKIVVYFNETDKVLVLNKTNATTISSLYGDETVNWQGKRITLYTTEVSYQGTQMLGIRVRLRPPGVDPGSS